MNETRENMIVQDNWVGVEAFFKKGIADRSFTGDYDGDNGVIENYRELVICNFLNGHTTLNGKTIEETLKGQRCEIVPISE
tara:strand:+ start:377 stop:619 length:243 start_codon:yes stop_codon:yes gene_type:complete